MKLKTKIILSLLSIVFFSWFSGFLIGYGIAKHLLCCWWGG